MIPSPYLSFDLGKKRIGVATKNRIGIITPLPTLFVQGPFPLFWEKHLPMLLEKYMPKGLLFGIPLQPNGEPSEQTRWVESIIEQTRGLTNLPIATVGELLTSVEAHERLFEMGIPSKKHKEYVDSIAAQIIAETYENKQKS
jgi:putative Holliday junction resolvase